MVPERVRKYRNNHNVYRRESLTHFQRWEEYFGFPNMPKVAYGALVTDQVWFRAKFYIKKVYFIRKIYSQDRCLTHMNVLDQRTPELFSSNNINIHLAL